MIRQLTIKNLAIIDDITIDFEENLNVLTGETGAGKSIIIDAISLIFGKRANSDIVAYGKDMAFISASLEVNDYIANYIYDNFDIDVFEEFIISRNISSSGKSSCKINGIATPLHVINEISSLLIDISSQNESQYLFNHKNHLKLLDTFIESNNPSFKEKYNKLYQQYVEVKNRQEELNNKKYQAGEIEFLQYKLNELKDYKYTIEEEQEIIAEYKYLNSYSQNIKSFEEIIDYLDNDNNGVNTQFYSAIKMLAKLSNNSKTEEFYERLNSLYLDVSDAIDDFKKEFSNDSVDLSRIDYLSNEISRINVLKRKYNTSNLLEVKNKLIADIDLYNNYEIELSKIDKLVKEAYEKAYNEAIKLSKIRKDNAKLLSKDVKNELVELYLSDASFSINFEEVSLNNNGIDDVEFYMSANKGVPERSLIKVASGGEVSRIMLGLKSVFSKLSKVDIIIFDEIDTGVSGKVALAMGKKMEKIAKSSQVLAITHLPQVAAMSDHHYYIFKKTVNNKTNTIVNSLSDSQKVTEVARLLSGNEVSDSFIEAAKELISSK